MKQFAMILFILTTSSFGSIASARDTDDIRSELLEARARIDSALTKLGQTRFSESKLVPKTVQGQCVADQTSSGYQFSMQVEDSTKFVKSRALAKCGDNCAIAVNFEYFYDRATDGPACKITAIATKK